MVIGIRPNHDLPMGGRRGPDWLTATLEAPPTTALPRLGAVLSRARGLRAIP